MDGGQSISFTSFDSYNYPSPNNLTFHQIEPINSQYELVKDSMIRNFPGKKVNLSQHLDVLVLLQTAQIQRLTTNLHEYRMKFKRILNNEKDYNSFKYQANELLQVKDQLQLKNKKIYQFAESQKGQLMDQFKYVQLLQDKYKRALKLIQDAHLSKQQTDLVNSQQKEALIAMERSFEAFKQKSIEEYQQLREECDRIKNEELSFEFGKFTQEKQRWGEIFARQEARYNAQRQKYESLLEQQRSKLISGSNQIEKLRRQLSQSHRLVEQLSQNSKKSQKERENSFALIGTEIQRLNTLLKEKSLQVQQLSQRLNKKSQQNDRLSKEVERYLNKNSLYEQQLNKQNSQISKLSTNVSSLTTKINEMGLLIQQKNVQLKLKDNKLVQQIQNYSQVLSKSQYVFNKEMEEYRLANISLGKELERIKKQISFKEEAYNRRQNELDTQLRSLQAQKNESLASLIRQSKKVQEIQERYKAENTKLTREVQSLRKKIQESYQQKQNLEESLRKQQRQFVQKSNRIYEEKWQELNNRYSQSNDKMQKLLENKQKLEQQVFSLTAALQRCELQKKEARKSKTFDSMIKQIESLCSSAMQKDGEIQKLNAIIAALQRQTRQVKKQLQQLRQVTVKLINISTANETSRRQDNYVMIEEIKKLFLRHSATIEEVKANTHKIAYNYNQHKEFLQESQVHLIKSKQFQIADLKQKLSIIEQQSQSKNELKEIINKIIVITKENTELKVAFNKKSLQNQHLIQEQQDLRKEFVKSNEMNKANLRDKDELCKRLYSQLEESNSLLYEERQNQIKLQSALLSLEEQKDRMGREAQSNDNLIHDLKKQIRSKEEERVKISEFSIDLERSVFRLRAQIQQQCQQKSNLQLIVKEKDEQFQHMKERCERIEQGNKLKEAQYEKYRQETISRLNQNHQQASMQISKLKSQINALIGENTELREQIIRTGSTIIAISSQNQSLKELQVKCNSQAQECQGYKRHIAQLLEDLHEAEMLRYQLQNVRMQGEFSKKQLEKSQKMLFSSSQRLQILQKQIQRLQAIINDFKMKNSKLESSTYDQSLTIERNKISQQKIVILSEQIDRLQKERMNLIEQLNVCRLQMSRDSTLDRQIKDNHFLLVLLFAEVEALREQHSRKEQELAELRKVSLK